MPYLKQQNDRGTVLMSWALGPDPLVAGRGDDANAKIDDSAMSRAHFKITFDKGTYLIEDQGSKNGTLVGGKPVTKQVLNDGDVIRAGQTNFLFEFGMSTMIGSVEKKTGKSLHSQLSDLYKRLDQD